MKLTRGTIIAGQSFEKGKKQFTIETTDQSEVVIGAPVVTMTLTNGDYNNLMILRENLKDSVNKSNDVNYTFNMNKGIDALNSLLGMPTTN